MFCKFAVGICLYFVLIFNNLQEIITFPQGLVLQNSADLAYQIFNSSNLLAYQQYDFGKEIHAERNKRWLEELYSYFYDPSEEDSSSEEYDYDDYETSDSDYTNKTKHGLCHNCNITYNQVYQLQHINHIVSTNSTTPTPATTPKIDIKTMSTTPSPQSTNIPQAKISDSNEKPITIPASTSSKVQPTSTVTAAATVTQKPIGTITNTEAETNLQTTTTTPVPIVAPTTIATATEITTAAEP